MGFSGRTVRASTAGVGSRMPFGSPRTAAGGCFARCATESRAARGPDIGMAPRSRASIARDLGGNQRSARCPRAVLSCGNESPAEPISRLRRTREVRGRGGFGSAIGPSVSEPTPSYRLRCSICHFRGPTLPRVFDLEVQVGVRHPHWKVLHRAGDGRIAWACPACSAAAPVRAPRRESAPPRSWKGPAVAAPEVYIIRRRESAGG